MYHIDFGDLVDKVSSLTYAKVCQFIVICFI